jgi:hypothetical protein
MGDKREVIPLRISAFNISFKEVLNRVKCFHKTLSHHDENSSVERLDFTALLGDSVTEMRKQLYEKLIGPYSQDFIREFIKWLKQQIKSNNDDVNPNFCLLYLDCVLSESVKEFQSSDMYSSSNFTNPGKLLDIVMGRSPLVEIFDLQCMDVKMEPNKERKFVLNLKGFQNLTSLTLAWKPTSHSLSFFTHLGGSCPKLTKLALHQYHFSIHNLLALMFGPKHNLLPVAMKQNDSMSLHNLQFSTESLTPICNSLNDFYATNFPHLELNITAEPSGPCCLDDHSAVAFILRHFRQLLEIDHWCNNIATISQITDLVCNSIELLHQTTNGNQEIVTTTISSPSLGSLQWTVNSPFTGKKTVYVVSV